MAQIRLFNTIGKPNETINSSGGYLAKTNGFVLKLHETEYTKQQDAAKQGWGDSIPRGIASVSNDNIKFEVSTSWKNTPGATLAEKFTTFMNDDLTKIAAGREYHSMIPTDEWTQKQVDEGSPISVSLNFRVYADERNIKFLGNNGKNFEEKEDLKNNVYLHIIRLLAKSTLPANGATPATAWGNIKNIGTNLGNLNKNLDALKQLNKKNDSSRKSMTADEVDKEMDKLKENDMGFIQRLLNAYIGTNMRQFTFTLATRNFSSTTVDWIVKSWSVKPSTEFIMKVNNNKTKDPIPLYCDFSLTLETNQILSNNTMMDMFKLH